MKNNQQKRQKQEKKIKKLNKYYFIFNQGKTISFLNDVLNNENSENEFTFYAKKDYFIICNEESNFNNIKYVIISYFKLNILLLFYNLKRFYYLHLAKEKGNRKNIFNDYLLSVLKKQLKTM